MSVTPISVEDEVDLWKLQRFASLGFDGGAIAAMLFWRISPHEVEALLWRDGVRTKCTHGQALAIVKPLDVTAGLAPVKLSECAICDGLGCEFCCPKD